MNFYINERFHLNNDEWLPSTKDELKSNIDFFLETLYCFNFLTEASVFYSSNGLDSLLNNLKDIEELSDYSLTNPLYQIRVLLKDIEATDWLSSQNHVSDHSYYLIQEGGAKTHYINNSSIAEAAERKLSGLQVAIIHFKSTSCSDTNPMYIIKSNINPPNNIVFCNIDIITDRVEALAYYKKSRKPRIYNWNPKHGENGKGVKENKGEEVSPLECSIEQASKLLEDAVGYRKTNELYIYDRDRNKYMVFKCDSKDENSYHSYHPIKQNEVMDTVKKFVGLFQEDN